MTTIIQPLRLFKILLIGDECEDVYRFGLCTRLSPESPVPVFKELSCERRPGMSANVRENLKSFGHDIIHVSNKQKITKTRFVEKRFFQHLLRVDNEQPLDPLRCDDIEWDNLHTQNLDAIVISDYSKGFVDSSAVEKCLSLGKKLSIPMIVDTKKTDLSIFKGCIIKINQHEFEKITSFPAKYDLIVTMGAHGARWKESIFPAENSSVYDVCGAGDVFLAAFVHKFLESTGDFKGSIEFANTCALKSVQNFGTYILTKEDIDDVCS